MPITPKESALANMIAIKDGNQYIVGYTADSVSIALDSLIIQLKSQAVESPGKKAKEIALDAVVSLYRRTGGVGSDTIVSDAEKIYEWLVK